MPLDIHNYRPDPQSGAGNCGCGRIREHEVHPHEARPSGLDPTRCVCGKACQDHPDWHGPRYRRSR